MKRIFFFIASLFLCHLAFAEDSKNLSMSKPTVSRVFTVNLKCNSTLSVGPFHNCDLDVLGLKHFQTGKKLDNILVYIDGGMPEHSHGLPTAPKVKRSNERSTYEIQGLKFSMPGKWQLRFHIVDEKYELDDVVTFNFEI